jgi:YVTN family beta-propeller protein
MRRHSTSRRLAIALATLLGLAGAVSGEVGVTDGPKGVVVNTRNGKAYAAFPDLGIVKIVNGVAGPVVTLKTGANVKNLTMDPRSGRVYAMNRGAGTISVIDPDSDAIVDTLKADRGIAINTKTNMIYVVNTHANSVSVIDGRANTVAATVPADKGPWAVAVNSASNMIYVANRLSDRVTVIDGRTNRAVQR